MFMSAESGELLQLNNIDNSFCAETTLGSTCLGIPPIISQEVQEQIGEMCDDLGSAVDTALSTNLALTLVLGFASETLFGMIRQLTFFVLIGMIEVPYPGNLLAFYKIIVNLSELDLLQGPTHYEKIFDFKET